MPDVTLRDAPTGVIGVFAPAAFLDDLSVPGATVCRIASDEVSVFCDPSDVVATLDSVAASATGVGGFAVDLSDGWTGYSLEGDYRRAFSYLSELHLPQAGFIQGDVLRVPVRALVHEDQLELFVPSPWGTYLHDEMLGALGALDVRDEVHA